MLNVSFAKKEIEKLLEKGYSYKKEGEQLIFYCDKNKKNEILKVEYSNETNTSIIFKEGKRQSGYFDSIAIFVDEKKAKEPSIGIAVYEHEAIGEISANITIR